MGTKSRETIYGASVRAAAERATEARKAADRLACEAWNKWMLGFQRPAQPSPAVGDALNAGEVKRLGCNTHQTVALDIVRRPKATPVQTPHGLRHAFASAADDLGFTEPTIAALLGHSGAV
jgi:integrase